ncbi:MAG: HAMP domain-containing histidine kinase [Sphingobacteriaceae bacterium]|nr:MAG: HAMP domain-containing histidine kinase [Sphingobacteriaceae bacterium]
MLHKIRILIENLIGVPVSANLESRIFNAVSFFVGLVLICNSITNYLLNLPVLAVLMFVTAGVAFFLYYLSRVKRQLGIAVMLFGLLGSAVLAVNFFYNSGIQGPTLLIFILLVFLLMAISPKKQHLFWMIFHAVIVSVLLLIDYSYPDLIKNSYATRFNLFADFGYSYLVVTVLIGLVMAYFKSNYNQQKLLLENRASQLADVNQTKDKLFSIIAHDLRSPMASIQNYLEILNEYKFTSEEKKTMEQELLSKTKNTDQLLSNLLYWSMNQINGVKVNLMALNLEETVEPVLQLAQVAAADKGIDIDNLLPPRVVLLGDKDMLQLMVRNLVNNAIKFTPPGGKIRVCCKIENQECKVMITDTGVGIAQKNHSHIFSIKTDSTYGTNQEKGTGLGLVLCKEFAELQNGTIGFTSNEGTGTTFFFKLKLISHQEIKPDTINFNGCFAEKIH